MEDMFSDNNSVHEPDDDIERVIEDTGDLRRESDEEDEADKKKVEDEKAQKVRKKIGPRPVLNAERLLGPRGLATVDYFFSDIKLSGRASHAAKDLDKILQRFELFSHRLYPRGNFDDNLKKIEKLGNQRSVKNYMKRYRLGMEDGTGQSEFVMEKPESPPPNTPNSSEAFDQLVSSTTGPEPSGASGSKTKMTAEQLERTLMNKRIAQEKMAALVKKVKESSWTQNVDVKVSSTSGD